MTAVSKKQERASLLSKRIIRTNRINSREAKKLQGRLDGYVAKQRQNSKVHEEEVQGIKANLHNVVSVKEKMEISPVRRKFLHDHGVNLHMKDVYMEDFITAVDNALVRRESSSLTSQGDERGSDTESCSGGSVPRIRSRSGKTEASSTVFGGEAFPLHVPLNLLQKRVKAKSISESSMSVESLVDDEDAPREKPRVLSAGAGGSKQSRPKSGDLKNFQYRVIKPPIKGRHITEVYKDMEEDEKLIKKLLERKKLHDRVKREESARKKVAHGENFAKGKSDGSDKKGCVNKRQAEVKEWRNLRCLVTDINEEDGVLNGFGDVDRHGKETAGEMNEEAKSSQAASNGRTQSNSDDEFEKLMQKSLRLKQEKELKTKPTSDNTAKNDHGHYLISSSVNVKHGNRGERSIYKPLAMKGDSTVSGPANNDQRIHFCEDFVNADPEAQVRPATPALLDSEKWSDLVKKVRRELRERETTNTQPLKRTTLGLSKNKISRISHPTAVGVDEDIIYDARPEKSVAKGYATMHMTVGKRSVSICVPRFKKEGVCKDQATMRANAKSEMNVEQVREKKHVKNLRATPLQ